MDGFFGGLLIGSILVLLAVIGFVDLIDGNEYKRGQLDARVRGKFIYEQRTNDVGEVKWERKRGETDGI